MNHLETVGRLGFRRLPGSPITQSYPEEKIIQYNKYINIVSAQTGQNINRSKINIIKANTKNNNPVTPGREPLEETDSFVYLGSRISNIRGTGEDVKPRVAFLVLRTILKKTQIKLNTKLKIFNSNVKSVLQYSS